MGEVVKAGVIGLGILGQQYLELFDGRPDIEIAAVCDVRKSAADKQAAQYGASAYSEVSAMLAEETLGLVVVATPDHLHLEPTMAAIAAGVPSIIQEKPFATSLADAEAIHEAVEKAGTLFFVNYANRAMPMDLATYYVVNQGLLGTPIYAETRLDDNISVPTALWGERSAEFAAGSSTAHFLLSHVSDMMHWLFAPAKVTDVFAISQEMVLGNTPDLYDAYLVFDSGLKTRCKAEWTRYMDSIVELYTSISGDQGTLIFNKYPGFGAEEGWRANLGEHSAATIDIDHHLQQLGQQGIYLRSSKHFRPDTDEYYASTVALSLEHTGAVGATGMMLVGPMLDAIAQGTLEPTSWQNRGPLPTHIDGLRQVQVVNAIIESSKSGEPVSLS